MSDHTATGLPTAVDRLLAQLQGSSVLWECLERLAQRRPRVFAPFGLDDLLGLVVRANRVQITPEIYRRKVARWQRHWPNLTVLPWEAGRGEVGKRRI